MKIEKLPSGSSMFQVHLQLHHTCFKIQEEDEVYEYAFDILNQEQALLYASTDHYLDEVIEEFLFYSGFIHVIKDQQGTLLYEAPPKKRFKVLLSEIQPSQFYINEKKLTELATWVKSDKDILIPVTKFQGQWVALDGHTRLKLAQLLNIKEVYAYEEETDAYIEDFVLFCKEQQKDSIYDLPIISETEYEVLWNQFCENYFKFLNQEN